MNSVAVKSCELINWSARVRALSGEAVSGDVHVVQDFPGGILVAAIDGAGHGNAARTAALIAAEILETHAAEPIDLLVQRCHTALTHSRGVAMSLVRFQESDDSIEWIGIGNVTGMLRRAAGAAAGVRKILPLSPGVVGYRLPFLRPSRVKVFFGDLLVLATDGIEPDFTDYVQCTGTLEQITTEIMNHHAKGNDDALVLVARYLGSEHE